MDRGCLHPILMVVETETELSVVPRVHVPAESGGPPAGSSGMQESQMPRSAAELAPQGCQLCPQDRGRLSHESPLHIGSEVISGWS